MHTKALKNTLQRKGRTPEVGEVLLGKLLRTSGKDLEAMKTFQTVEPFLSFSLHHLRKG